jgi:hypothetical protein
MANPAPVLSLKDIHMPTEIGIWPLAPGWYFLSILIFVVSFLVCIKIYKWYLQRQPKRAALAMLAEFAKDYERTGDSKQTSIQLSRLLRQVALIYYPREMVASLHQDAWIEFLNRTGKGVDFSPIAFMLLELPFKPNCVINIKPLFVRVEAWIKQQKGQACFN